jgi:hypothetical protein
MVADAALVHSKHARRLLGGAILLSVLSLTACRPGLPSSDTPASITPPDSTITGTVRGPESSTAIEGRLVEALNVDTGEVQRDTTSSTGHFTFRLRPGKYRVEITLHDGESLIKHPGVMDLNRSDVDAHADFLVGVVRTSRPRHPGSLSGSGLGQPIA